MTDGQLRNGVDPAKFNSSAEFPYSLRLLDFQAAMQDVYHLFYDVNGLLLAACAASISGAYANDSTRSGTEGWRSNQRGRKEARWTRAR